jgi:hypothetical protein
MGVFFRWVWKGLLRPGTNGERLRELVELIDNHGSIGDAKALNDRQIATARGGKWTARSVLNLTARLA